MLHLTNCPIKSLFVLPELETKANLKLVVPPYVNIAGSIDGSVWCILSLAAATSPNTYSVAFVWLFPNVHKCDLKTHTHWVTFITFVWWHHPICIPVLKESVFSKIFCDMFCQWLAFMCQLISKQVTFPECFCGQKDILWPRNASP